MTKNPLLRKPPACNYPMSHLCTWPYSSGRLWPCRVINSGLARSLFERWPHCCLVNRDGQMGRELRLYACGCEILVDVKYHDFVFRRQQGSLSTVCLWKLDTLGGHEIVNCNCSEVFLCHFELFWCVLKFVLRNRIVDHEFVKSVKRARCNVSKHVRESYCAVSWLLIVIFYRFTVICYLHVVIRHIIRMQSLPLCNVLLYTCNFWCFEIETIFKITGELFDCLA